MTSGTPMAVSYYCQFVAASITHQAVVATGCWHCYCWLPMALFSWLFMALFLLAFHGIIIILAVAIGEWPFATLSQFVPCSVIFSACPLINLPSFAKVWAGLPIGHLYVCMYVCMSRHVINCHRGVALMTVSLPMAHWLSKQCLNSCYYVYLLLWG